MTTIDGTTTLTSVLAYWFTKRLQRTQAQKAKNRVYVGAWLALVRLGLHVAGFSCLTYAAFLWHMIAGFSVAGILLLVLSTLMTGRASTPNDVGR